MSRIFYISGLQVLIVILLIFLLLPAILHYIVLPLLVLGLAIMLFRKVRQWLQKIKIFPQRRHATVYRYDTMSGPIIDIQAIKE